ncbi:hypothetical protein EDB89DRAFT_1906348 [Lactarius sanguifluus]|nr:hypothetical protein EDB89DRAFT_1906348 [Lactarius sanguifluus]
MWSSESFGLEKTSLNQLKTGLQSTFQNFGFNEQGCPNLPRSLDWTPTSAATCQQPPSCIVNCIALAQETLKRFQTRSRSRWVPQHDNNATPCPHNSDAVPGPHDNNTAPCPHNSDVMPGPYDSATTQ